MTIASVIKRRKRNDNILRAVGVTYIPDKNDCEFRLPWFQLVKWREETVAQKDYGGRNVSSSEI